MLDGYPSGAAVHGIEGVNASALRRISVFMSELRSVVQWLKFIPVNIDVSAGDQDYIYEGIADAALLAFCRCFDLDHPLRPLKVKKMLSVEQRSQLDRIKSVRNKLVAHDAQLFNGAFSLIVRSSNFEAIEAVSMNLLTPFVALAELDDLRALSKIVFDWVKAEHERVATEIVKAYNQSPMSERISAPSFTINVRTKDHFASKAMRVLPR